MTDQVSAITGEQEITVGEETYCLVLGMRGLAKFQAEFGGVGVFKVEDGQLPNLMAYVRVVELALARHHPDAAEEVVDAILAQDFTVVGRLINAAMPKASTTNAGGNAAKKPKARTTKP